MNTDHVIDELARDISIGLQIGETQLWSALESITISGVEEVPDPGDSPTAVTVSRYYSIIDAATSSGILKAKQKLSRTFNFDKLGGIAFTKISKLTMCSA